MANANPEILKWARKSARISLEKAASTISKTCKAERIKDWESPDQKDKPSIKQVEKLARLYRRPANIFYLPYIPKDYPPLKDFRRNKEEGYGTALIFMMREIQEKHEWLKIFLLKNREKKLDFVGRFNIKNSPENVALDIRKTLGINSRLASEKPLKYWIEKAEQKKIYVSLSSNYHPRLKLDSDVFKGFVIADSHAPFIFLNSDDWDHGQLFTFVHELAHIWIGVSGVSNETEINPMNKGLHVVERFCNEVAVKALLPKEEILPYLPSDKKEITFKNIAKAARKLGVSNIAIINRLTEFNILDEIKFKTLRNDAENVWKEYLFKISQKKKSSGGPNYYIMQLRRSGKAFSNVIMNFYKSGKINSAEASRLLKVKEGNFVKFEKYIYK